jgi:hypothetical protein
VQRGPDASQLPFATQVAMKSNPVTLYSGRDCTDACAQGRSPAARHPYSERDAQGNKEAADALKALIDDLFIHAGRGQDAAQGLHGKRLAIRVDSAGYPRSALPGQVLPKPPRRPKKAPEPPPAAAATPPEPQVELTTERR